MRENKFQADLIVELKLRFPGCVVLKNDSSYLPGVPDLTIFYEDTWAMLECKAHENSRTQPNQRYYVDKFNEMSYAAFIHPDNKKEILDELQQAFGINR